MKILPNFLQANLLIGILCFVSCTVKVPSHIIQPDDMEEFLYDYHLMQAMAGELKTSERYKRNLYEQYVFDKHHISEAEFDSSLVWYMRHPKELESIYKNLDQRFTAQKELLEASVPPGKRVKQESPYGDSVDIWNDHHLFRLNGTPLNNKLQIALEADSNYHANDSFEWLVDALFLQDTVMSQTVMSLTAIYDNDTIGNSLPISASGKYSLTLPGDSSSAIKKLSGYIYYYPVKNGSMATDTFDTILQPTLLLSGIKLMRYHHNDSIRVDSTNVQIQTADSTSTQTDTEKTVPEKIRNPKPIRATRVQPQSPHAETKEIRFESVR